MRQPHKVSHPECPHANWAACDLAQKVQWGQCKALVDDKPEPHPCSRWAVSEEGWCGQHYASEKEQQRKAAAIAIARADLLARIDEFIAWTAAHPSVHDSPSGYRPAMAAESTVGLAGVPGVEPSKVVLETAPPPRLTPVRFARPE